MRKNNFITHNFFTLSLTPVFSDKIFTYFKNAFTLVEVMIAFFISALIMTYTMSMQSNLAQSLRRARSSLEVVHKASLVIAQLEKDLSTLCVPFLQEPIEADEKKADQKDGQESTQDKNHDKNKKEKQDAPTDPNQKKKEAQARLQKIFTLSVYDDDDKKIRGERWKLFHHLSGVSTHAFVVYKEAVPLLVRIGYELVLDKKKSSGDKKSYKLFRKQTVAIDNSDFKVADDRITREAEGVEAAEISKLLIAEDIAFLSIKVTTEKKEKELALEKIFREREKKERELVERFIWGGEGEYSGHLPCCMTLYLSFWNDRDQEVVFESAWPIFSYPTEYPAHINALLTTTDKSLENINTEQLSADQQNQAQQGQNSQQASQAQGASSP